jgi:alkylation response protein AidB-like acyl-CoA dehydrogenase
METELCQARLANDRLMQIGATWAPGPETTNAVAMARTLAAEAAIGTVEKALELVGGRSFYRDLGLERIYRDVQGARFHPLTLTPQRQFTGRFALGLDLDGAAV